jgi:hypothetical protein
MSAWRDRTLFIVLSKVISSSGLKDFSDNSFGICSKLMQQLRICRSDLLEQCLCHRRVLSHDLTHIRQLSRRKLGHPSTPTAKSDRILLPLLLLLLSKLEEISGSSLLGGLLNRGWVRGRLLRLGLGGLLSRWWRG